MTNTHLLVDWKSTDMIRAEREFDEAVAHAEAELAAVTERFALIEAEAAAAEEETPASPSGPPSAPNARRPRPAGEGDDDFSVRTYLLDPREQRGTSDVRGREF